VHYREINPFRGLESFDSEHAPFFCGRIKIVREALDLLRQQVADKKPFLLGAWSRRLFSPKKCFTQSWTKILSLL